MTEDVDPEDPRPEGRYHVEAESTWYYVHDDLADTIAAGPATTGSSHSPLPARPQMIGSASASG